MPILGQTRDEEPPADSTPTQQEAWYEWRLYSILSGTLAAHYITPDDEGRVKYWLGKVKTNGSQFSEANDHVEMMDGATRAHDVYTSNNEAQTAADILRSIHLSSAYPADQFNVNAPPYQVSPGNLPPDLVQLLSMLPNRGQVPNPDGTPPVAPQRPNLAGGTEQVFYPVSPEIDQTFRDSVAQAWQGLPAHHRATLQKAGVRVLTTSDLVTESGTPGLYSPSNKLISIAPTSTYQDPSMTMTMKTRDPAGTLQHEAGHALYNVLHLSQWTLFQNTYQLEARSVPYDLNGPLGHFIGPDGPTETFAELYAGLQGRMSPRTQLLQQAFPNLNSLVRGVFGNSQR